MNKTELIKEVAKRSGLSLKDAKKGIDMTLHIVNELIKKGQKLSIVGFGTFFVHERKARMGRHPQTGEKIKIESKKVVKFKPGKLLLEAANANTKNTKNKKK